MKNPSEVTVRAMSVGFILLCSLPLCALVSSEDFTDRPVSNHHIGQEVTLYANNRSMAGSANPVKTELPDTVYVDAAFTASTPGWGDDHFNSIKDGIAWVEPGGTVMVAAGTYAESVSINKALTLQGAGRETTIIRAQDNAIAIYIATSDVTITGFTIQDGKGGTFGGGIVNDWTSHGIRVEDCIIENSQNAFFLNGNNHHIKNNIIRNNYRGVWVNGSKSVMVSGNLIEGHTMQGIDGRGQNVLIKDNHIRDNLHGITMSGGAVGNTLTNNLIEDNRSVGIVIFNESSTGHMIHSNTIQRNKDYGIQIYFHSRGHSSRQSQMAHSGVSKTTTGTLNGEGYKSEDE
jgi:parallel beta-helix repeat protein